MVGKLEYFDIHFAYLFYCEKILICIIRLSSLKTEDNLSVITKIPLEKLLIETDSPWCEIKQTSAAYKHVKTKLLAVKKEKWNENSIVKGRNEPSNIM